MFYYKHIIKTSLCTYFKDFVSTSEKNNAEIFSNDLLDSNH